MSVAAWAAEQRFRIAAQTVHHAIDWTESGRAYANIGDAVVQGFCRNEDHPKEDVRENPGATLVAVALGPYGTQELTHGTPADLLFFCQGDPAESNSSGTFCRRLLLRLASSTLEGKPLDVHMGATPYGTRAPIITQIEPFLSFCEAGGSPRSVLALTQARVIFGPASLVEEIERALTAFLVSGKAWRHLSDQSEEVLQTLRTGATSRFWDLRHCRGGLEELETLIAFLQIRAAPIDPGALTSSRGDALAILITMGQLDEEAGRQLIEAHHLLRQTESFLAATTGIRFEPDAAPSRLKAALARACGAERFEVLETRLQNATTLVSASLDQILTDTA